MSDTHAADNTRPRVIVTGAEGFIGGTLIEALRHDYKIIGLDRTIDGDPTQPPGVDWIACDLTEPASIQSALASIKEKYGDTIAGVIHLAAYFDFSGEQHPLYETLNVKGTQYLLEALQGFTVERFVYSSTMLVHEPAKPGLPINEDTPLAPKWAYPESKYRAEQAIEQSRGTIPVAILRLAGVYTHNCQSPTLAHQIQRIYEDKLTSRVYAGDPEVGQSALHLDDMVSAFAAVLDKRRELPANYIALIGEPFVVTYAALQRVIGESLHDHPYPAVEMPKSVAKAGAWLQDRAETVIPDALDEGQKPFIRPFMIDLAEDHYELNISHARQTLGWEPQHTLREELPTMLEQLRHDPVAWYDINDLHKPAWLRQLAGETDKDPDAIQRQKETLENTLYDEHHNWQWAHGVTAGLGAWLVASPVTTGYWGSWLGYSDLVAGALIIVFGLLSLSQEFTWARWGNAVTGLWVAFAPLLFWTDSATAYLNGTLVGLAVAGLAIIAKPVIGMGEQAKYERRAIPPGWDYCPSDWSQRLPIVILAVVGLLISRYLAAYQLGHTPAAWDPFFGSGTEDVITSKISEKWPIPDAGLGGFVYLLEILAGLMGTKYRWHQMPWLTLLFGFLIVPLGAVSIYFIIIQPIVIGTWCTLCLIAAAAMLLQIPYSLDEILATCQFLIRSHRTGQQHWLRTLFQGGMVTPEVEGEYRGQQEAKESQTPSIGETLLGSGVTPNWPLCLSIVIGVALMCSRLLFGTEPGLAHSDHLLGAFVITVAVTSFAEAARSLRWVNCVLGCALIGAPFLFSGGTLMGEIFDVVAGILLIGLSIPKGKIAHRLGTWNQYVV